MNGHTCFGIRLRVALTVLLVMTTWLMACGGTATQSRTAKGPFPTVEPLPTSTAEPGMVIDPRRVISLTSGGTYTYDNVTLRVDQEADGMRALINTQTLEAVIREINLVNGDEKNIPTLVITFRQGLGSYPQYTAGEIGQGVIDAELPPDQLTIQIVIVLYSAAHGSSPASESAAVPFWQASQCISEEAYEQPGMAKSQIDEYIALKELLCYEGAPPIVEIEPTP